MKGYPFNACLENPLGTCNFIYFQAEERPKPKYHTSRVGAKLAAHLYRGPHMLSGTSFSGRSSQGHFENRYLQGFCPITKIQGVEGFFRCRQSWVYFETHFNLSGEFSCQKRRKQLDEALETTDTSKSRGWDLRETRQQRQVPLQIRNLLKEKS